MIETLVAVALFGVGLAALFQSFGRGAEQMAHERHTTRALHAAETVMESLLVRNIDDGLNLIECFDTNGVQLPGDRCIDRQAYEVEGQVTPVPGIPGLLELAVVVSWFEGGTKHDFRLVTRRY